MTAALSMSVIVPTYRRPADLRRCLLALTRQSRAPDQLIVVAREGDGETLSVLSEPMVACAQPFLALVTTPGQVAALNRGLDKADGDIVAITDDDTEAASDWLFRIEQHYIADTFVGGVGGRDDWYIEGRRVGGSADTVGVVRWFGRYVGNHHLGHGAARSVDILKGANMSYRRDAIGSQRFDERLRGDGAQVANDMQFALTIRRRGWALIYDPDVVVRHHLAVRHDDDQRSLRSERAQVNVAHNQTVALMDFLYPWQRPVFVLWAFLIGTREVPGLAQAIRLRFIVPAAHRPSLRAALAGRVDGLRTWMASR